MDHYSLKFRIEIGVEFFGVFFYAVDANKDISGNVVTGIVVEGDDIGKCAVIKILFIQVSKEIVSRKNELYLRWKFMICKNDSLHPNAMFGSLF